MFRKPIVNRFLFCEFKRRSVTRENIIWIVLIAKKRSVNSAPNHSLVASKKDFISFVHASKNAHDRMAPRHVMIKRALEYMYIVL